MNRMTLLGALVFAMATVGVCVAFEQDAAFTASLAVGNFMAFMSGAMFAQPAECHECDEIIDEHDESPYGWQSIDLPEQAGQVS